MFRQHHGKPEISHFNGSASLLARQQKILRLSTVIVTAIEVTKLMHANLLDVHIFDDLIRQLWLCGILHDDDYKSFIIIIIIIYLPAKA